MWTDSDESCSAWVVYQAVLTIRFLPHAPPYPEKCGLAVSKIPRYCAPGYAGCGRRYLRRGTTVIADQPSLPRLYSATGTALRRS